MRGNSHARCGAGEKPEEIECGLRPHSNTKGLPIAIVPLRDFNLLERLALSAEPQCPLYRRYKGQGAADRGRPGGNRGCHGGEREKEPPLYRPEAAAAGKGYVRWGF